METASPEFESSWRELATEELGPLGAQTQLVCAELARCAASLEQHDGVRALHLFREWLSWVWNVRSALNPLVNENEYLEGERERVRKLVADHYWWKIPGQMIWGFPEIKVDPFRKFPKESWHVNQQELDNVVEEYVRSACVSPLLERIFVSAYAFAEVEGFQYSLSVNRLGVMGSVRAIATDSEPSPGWEASKMVAREMAKLFAKGACLFFLGVLSFDWAGPQAAVLVAVLFYALFTIAGRLKPPAADDSHLQSTKLLVDMSLLTQLVSKGEASPGQLLHLVKDSTSRGALWPKLLWAVLQRAEHRCPWTFRPHQHVATRESALEPGVG